MELFQIIADLAAASVEEVTAFVAAAEQTIRDIKDDPASFITDERDEAALLAEMESGVAALEAARAHLASLAPAEPVVVDQSAFDALAERATAVAAAEEPSDPVEDDDPADPSTDDDNDPAAALAVEAPETVVASADPAPAPRLPARPAQSAESTPAATPSGSRVSLTAAAPNLGHDIGEDIGGLEIAEMMIRRRGQFGRIPGGTRGEQIPIGMFDWRDSYSDERTLGTNEAENMAKIAAVVDDGVIREELRRRAEGSLVASGGLCAPVTPYYDLQMISVADRPVRAALPSFNASRGGIRAARPASLADITDAVGVKTAAQDEAGGTTAQKTCQVISCPTFDEYDVEIIYHCLQFGNLGARTFPELVAQWNNLVLAAHARTAESQLLTGIDGNSTAVTAGDLGLGATATIPSQVLTAAAAVRNRNRMAPDAVLRVMFPAWVLDMFVSDQYRTQFQRYDMDQAAFVALLRKANIEPSWYIDGAAGAGQVFGTQAAAGLDSFPSTVRWYIFPEGSHLYLDGGTLELGLVRDSVLNETNDFQIFGESFESVAFLGIESLAVTTTVCDSGVVALPNDPTNCGTY